MRCCTISSAPDIFRKGGPLRGGPLVIAFGNTIRCDDGSAHLTAEILASDPDFHGRVIAVHQLGPELSLEIATSTIVVFVDAREPDGRREVKVNRIHERPDDAPRLDHRLRPAYLLTMAKRIFGWTPEARLVTIPSECMGFGEQLSETARAGAIEAADMIRKLVEDYLEGRA